MIQRMSECTLKVATIIGNIYIQEKERNIMTVGRILKGHDLFQALNVNQMNEISVFSSVRKLNTHEILFTHGAPSSHVFMLMEGSVNLLLPAKSRDFDLIVSKIDKGELFGLSPLLDSKKYTTTARCTEPTQVLAIEAKPFRELLKSDPLVGFDIMNQVARVYFARYIEVLKSLQGVVSQISLIR